MSAFRYSPTTPASGRSAAQLAPDLRRHEHQSHIIFYAPKKTGALIVRVLHTRIDANRHFDETDEHRA
jgi:toxin ParE1/3/4